MTQCAGGGGGGIGVPKTNNQNFFLHSITQSQLPANTLLCVVLSSTGIITAETFCIFVIHIVLSNVLSFIPIINIFFVAGYITIFYSLKCRYCG
jgi:hypothetical protein